jgi:hypothetical protein
MADHIHVLTDQQIQTALENQIALLSGYRF